MMNVYDEAVAPEKRTAHEELLRKLAQRLNVPSNVLRKAPFL